jgi:hypothetical protein
LVGDGASPSRLLEEIAHCEVVCVNCHRRRTSRRGGWWRNDPSRIGDSPRLTPGEVRNLILLHGVLEASGCVDCGESEIVVLDFDHIGSKTANVPMLARQGCSLERLKAEIAQCAVRCANCHRRRTLASARSRAA